MNSSATPGVLPVAVIGAGPVGLAAAARLADRDQAFVLFESGQGPGSAVTDWGHVTFFSPWRHVVDDAARRLLQQTGWAMPDPPPGRVGHTRERDDVLRVGQHGQVGDRVLDLGALVELRAADDLVADVAAHERVLDHARLRVGPVEDRDLRPAGALVDEPLDLADDEARLGMLVVELADAHRVAVAVIGPQRFRLLVAVVRDDGVRRAEDRLRRAVVLLELDDVGVHVVLLEVQDIFYVRSAEPVDRIVREQPAGDEVVGALDVEVVDGSIQRDALDPFVALTFAAAVTSRIRPASAKQDS